ncbi:cell surface protein [Secundilactobacillus kimchicus]|uniref:CdaR family protein n=1 Tax=Secundilactobacillus kimchicus TaxID=528209 RepID=UPI001C02C795|nr:CdaR family protein [Secundilactobacillus kimchicus]MBT9670924.1 cell surface protein [Secundilactobacillus kimchicus]
MSNFFNSKWVYRLLSLILAVGLFLFVNTTQSMTTSRGGESNTRLTTLTATERKTVSVQLRLNVDSDKYFVTGYPESVKVHLSGPASLVTATANTQNFRVFADLGSLGKGKHTVKLQQDGLNKEIKATIDPATITVNIQPRQTVSYPVKVNYDKGKIAENYEAGTPTTDVTNVKATGAQSEIARIDRVVAEINVPQNAKSTVNTQAVIEALDKQGRTVNVILTPSTTQASLPITAKGHSKRVALGFRAKGGSDDQNYTITSPTKKVRIFGTETELEAIDKVTMDVDVSDVKDKKTKTISLDPDDEDVNGIDPASVKVTITAKTN